MKGIYRFAVLLPVIFSVFISLLGCSDEATSPPPSAKKLSWEHPLPQGNSLHDVWSASETDIFAVGDYGTVLHYNGSVWSRMENVSTFDRLFAVWGTAGDNVYVAGENGKILHYNGSVWKVAYQYVSSEPTTFLAMWGFSATDIYVGGYGGVLLHYDGTSWRKMETGTEDYITAIWGIAPDNMYAVCNNNGRVLHYDGTAWSQVANTQEHLWLDCIWGTSEDNIYTFGHNTLPPGTIFGYHFDGSTWTPIDAGTLYNARINRIRGNSPDQIYAVGDATLFYDGTDWLPMTTPTVPMMFGLANAGNDQLVAVGEYSAIMHYGSSSWSSNFEMKELIGFSCIWGSAADNIYAAGGSNSLMHYDGHSWELVELPVSDDLEVRGVWGTSGKDIYAVGMNILDDYDGFVCHYNGDRWTAMVEGYRFGFYGVWGSASNDVFVVGANGTIMHYDGKEWLRQDAGPIHDVFCVWGSAGNNVFAGGSFGEILHYDGNSWTSMGSFSDSEIRRMIGFSDREIYASTQSDTLLAYDGTTWEEKLILPSGVDIQGLWGTSGKDLYILDSSQSSFYHFDGEVLTEIANPLTDQASFAVWGPSSSLIYLAGATGHILKYQ